MRIRVIAVGRLKAGPERDLADRYRERAGALARSLGLAGPDLVELPEGRARTPEERMRIEAAAIRDRAGPALIVALDERAPSPTSEEVAMRLSGWRDGGRGPVAFVIGGPDGLAPEIAREAAWSLSFGRMTLPHQLVRLLCLEQIYRAFTIIAGHPYHRAGGGDA